MQDQTQTIIDLTQKLLEAILSKNYLVYKELCDENLTAFEPEGFNLLIKGMEFHKYFFENIDQKSGFVTISNPDVRFYGKEKDVAVICFNRLIQSGISKIVPPRF